MFNSSNLARVRVCLTTNDQHSLSADAVTKPRRGTHLAKVVSILESLDLDLDALLVGKRPLGLFDLSLEFTHGSLVAGNVGTARLALVFLDKVVDDTVVEIFSSQVGVTGGREDLEDALFDREEGDIESTTTEIVDDDLRFGLASSVETVSCGNGDTRRGQSGVSRRVDYVRWLCNTYR